MRKRLIQVFGFLISTFGWTFVSLTLAMNIWKILFVGGKGGSWMIKSSWYWSNLWKECATDTSSVTDCREYEALWPVTPYVQAVRGLLAIAMSMGLIATILCFFGMDCTYIGGNNTNKRKVLLAGTVFHFLGGTSSLAAYCLYTNRVARAAFAPAADRTLIRYSLGPAVFLGLIGSFLIILGSVLYAVTFIPVRKKSSSVGRSLYVPPSYGQRSKTLYTSMYSVPSRQSSSRVSRMSQATDEKPEARDTFV